MSNQKNQSLNKLEKAKAKNKNEESTVNMRFVRGMELAASGNVRKIVPSTTSAILYKVQSQNRPNEEYSVVVMATGEVTCDCPDFSRRNITCKHIYAVVCSDVSLEVKIVAGHEIEKADPRETFTGTGSVMPERVVYEP